MGVLQSAQRGVTPLLNARESFDAVVTEHFHALWPDGVFTCAPFGRDAQFWPADPLRGSDVERLTRAIRHRVLRLLRQRGKLDDDDLPADDPAQAELSLHETLGAAAVQGRIAFGENAGAQVPRRGRGTATAAGEFRRGALRADCEGFSLHAGVCIPESCPERLEKLCRYAARPPIVHERMAFSDDGTKVLYTLKRRWRSGAPAAHAR